MDYIILIICLTGLIGSCTAGNCIKYCGNATGIDCPSGYSCVVWDVCGTQCLRTGQYQPEGCPMAGCLAISCPLGFIRYSNGCEGCTCANQTLVDAIESQYNSGFTVQLSTILYFLPVLLCWICGSRQLDS